MKERIQILAFGVGLLVIVTLFITLISMSVLARFGIGTDWYCRHLATKEDMFCVVKALETK